MKSFTFQKSNFKGILLISMCLAFMLTSLNLKAQSYSYGNLPSNASVSDSEEAYDAFMSIFFEDCGDNGRIRWGIDGNSWETPDQTVSEGIAYGMLFAAYYDDQTTFDKLWNYYKAFPDEFGLMNWKTEGCYTTVEEYAATDADLDAAMALIVADKKWGNSGSINYANDAAWIIGVIKEYEVESSTNVLKPGDVWGGSSVTNISYFSPGYFRVFGSYTGDEDFWDAVAEKCYDIIDANLSANNAVGGLVSDWCTSTGTEATGMSLNYSYDACRTPWRIATDYVWFGEERAKTYLDKSNYFVQDYIGGIDEVVDGYQQDGTVTGSYHNSTFVAMFSCAGVALTSDSEINEYYTEMVSLGQYSYFDYLMDLFGRTMLSGLFYNPLEDGTSDVSVTGVSVSPTSLSISVGATGTLSASASPSNASNTSVTWSSSNTSVATVSSGVVTGKSAGSATITATTADGGYTASSAITVNSTSVTYYSLSTSVDGSGSISLSPSGGSYSSGTVVTATASASSGYSFSNWSGDASGTSSSVSITMNSNNSIVANFDEDDTSNGETCDNPTNISVSFSNEGSGEYCWVTSDDISYVNSWNLNSLEINGESFLNHWSNSLPAKIDGNYYISYSASYSWSYFEAVSYFKNAADVSETSSLNVFPNPFNETISVQIRNPEDVQSITVYNTLGQLVKEVNISDISSTTSINIDDESSVFILKVKTKTEVLTKVLTKN